MSRPVFTRKQQLALATPGALLLIMYLLFHGCVALFGYPLGYLMAFLIYWIGWCLLLPLFFLGGPSGMLDLFREGEPNFTRLGWKTQVLLWWTIVFPLAFIFVRRLSALSGPLLVVSILLGIVTGISEEILWRGVYIELFPESLWLSAIYPSVMFGLWHVCPQSVRPNRLPGGVASFVLYAT